MNTRLLTRIAAPATEPLSVSEVKIYLRLDTATEDTLIGDLIKAARSVAEEHLRRSLITQSWRLVAGPVTADRLILPRGPVQSITQIATVSSSGDANVLQTQFYRLDVGRDAVYLTHSPDSERIEIEYATGYGLAQHIPEALKQGMLMHIAALYEQRPEGSLPDSVRALYAAFREMRL